jgi:hypothetical protein
MLTVPLKSKRRERALAVQKFQHAIPAVPLLFTGLQALQAGEHGFALALALFEIGTSVMLLGTVVREIRTLRRPRPHAAHAHHGVDWVHFFAASVLVAEVLEHYHLTHHIRRPAVLTAIITLALGLSHGHLTRFGESRRVMRLDDEGLHIGGKFVWQVFRARWADITSIVVADQVARITTRDGRERKLNLADLHGAAEVRAALAEAVTRADEAKTREP